MGRRRRACGCVQVWADAGWFEAVVRGGGSIDWLARRMQCDGVSFRNALLHPDTGVDMEALGELIFDGGFEQKLRVLYVID